jgi:hypothetical protein
MKRLLRNKSGLCAYALLTIVLVLLASMAFALAPKDEALQKKMVTLKNAQDQDTTTTAFLQADGLQKALFDGVDGLTKFETITGNVARAPTYATFLALNADATQIKVTNTLATLLGHIKGERVEQQQAILLVLPEKWIPFAAAFENIAQQRTMKIDGAATKQEDAFWTAYDTLKRSFQQAVTFVDIPVNEETGTQFQQAITMATEIRDGPPIKVEKGTIEGLLITAAENTDIVPAHQPAFAFVLINNEDIRAAPLVKRGAFAGLMIAGVQDNFPNPFNLTPDGEIVVLLL